MASGHVVGVDLGGTNTNVCLLDEANIEVARAHLPTDAERGPSDVLHRVAQHIRSLYTDAGLTLDAIEAVGVAVASPIDIDRGMALHGSNLGWINVPVRDMLEEHLDTRVIIDNDVNAAAWGESQLGAGIGARNMLGAWIGTGVGGGLVLDGALYHGSFDTAGELGHVIVEPEGPPTRRTLEHHCGRNGLSAIARSRITAGTTSRLSTSFNDHGIVPSWEWRTAYDEGDELAVELIDAAGLLLGSAIASSVTLLSLERVVLGGGMVETLGQILVGRIRSAFSELVFPAACRACELRISELDASAGLYGAAMLARNPNGSMR